MVFYEKYGAKKYEKIWCQALKIATGQ